MRVLGWRCVVGRIGRMLFVEEEEEREREREREREGYEEGVRFVVGIVFLVGTGFGVWGFMVMG